MKKDSTDEDSDEDFNQTNSAKSYKLYIINASNF